MEKKKKRRRKENNWRNLYFFTMLKRSSEKLKRLNNVNLCITCWRWIEKKKKRRKEKSKVVTLSGNVRIWNPLRRGLRYACDRSRDRRGYLSGARGGPTSRGPRGGLASLLVGPRKKTRDNRGTGTTHAESLTSQADTRTMDGLVQNPNKRPGTDLRKFYRAAPIRPSAGNTNAFLPREILSCETMRNEIGDEYCYVPRRRWHFFENSECTIIFGWLEWRSSWKWKLFVYKDEDESSKWIGKLFLRIEKCTLKVHQESSIWNVRN